MCILFSLVTDQITRPQQSIIFGLCSFGALAQVSGRINLQEEEEEEDEEEEEEEEEEVFA